MSNPGHCFTQVRSSVFSVSIEKLARCASLKISPNLSAGKIQPTIAAVVSDWGRISGVVYVDQRTAFFSVTA